MDRYGDNYSQEPEIDMWIKCTYFLIGALSIVLATEVIVGVIIGGIWL